LHQDAPDARRSCDLCLLNIPLLMQPLMFGILEYISRGRRRGEPILCEHLSLSRRHGLRTDESFTRQAAYVAHHSGQQQLGRTSDV
jgi:hypothetical protein